jgi:ribulose-5-phosphate 4-epimerase/fuculose-1-phosphate aldolase
LINHDSLLFYDGLATFNDTVGLVTDAEMGRAVAQALASRNVVLMRNHGVLVVGKDIPWLVYTALTLERAIMVQSLAQSLGTLAPFSNEMAARTFQGKYRDQFTENYWDYLVRKLKNAGLDRGMPESSA